MTRHSRRAWLRWAGSAVCSTLACTAVGGCAHYRVGADTLYAADIKTVYVPMFESASFRRNLGERLTEAVVKEIELRTPFKVVSTPEADSILSGKITTESKRLVIESPTDEGREVEVNLRVHVTWANRRTGVCVREGELPVPAMADVAFAASYVPEIGQSVATAQEKAIRDLAAQIVNLMEEPW